MEKVQVRDMGHFAVCGVLRSRGYADHAFDDTDRDTIEIGSVTGVETPEPQLRADTLLSAFAAIRPPACALPLTPSALRVIGY
ncbi:hypothetical protein ACWEQC_01140 [Streptomyces shenzhenensis]